MDRETGRIEAFSDGVFAIAVTLLVLEIRVPTGPDLAAAVARQWPSFAAYAASFTIILIIWIHHHTIFRLVRHADRPFQFINGLLLMVVTFLNYPTALLATRLGTPDARFAALFYNGTCFVVAVLSNVLWRYAVHRRRLLHDEADARVVRFIDAQYRFGPFVFLIVLGVTYVSAVAGLLGNLVLAIYYALAADVPRKRAPEAR
jgi:uncharacterized membrane protein